MNALHDIVTDHRVIVCVGSGGVGKTTTSAVVALHAALTGRKTLVLTIDPARRLANSLGLEGIDHDESQVPLTEILDREHAPGGELWAMMLDMKRAFDNVVLSNTDPQTAQRILDNRFYQSFSSSLSGTQEYSAIERLCQLDSEGRYDLIVLDTPPTQHALDFLDAPDRLYDALDNAALQWLYKPALASGKVGLGVLKFGAKRIRKTIGKLTGSRMLDDTAVFLENLAPIFGGMKDRARRVRQLLHSRSTTFLVVTTPDPLTIAEAVDFDRRLKGEAVHFGGFVVNRVHLPVRRSDEPMPSVAQLSASLLRIPGARHVGRHQLTRMSKTLLRNAEDFDGLAFVDARMLDKLTSDGTVPVFPIPFYATDIYSIRGLERVRGDLFEDEERYAQ